LVGLIAKATEVWGDQERGNWSQLKEMNLGISDEKEIILLQSKKGGDCSRKKAVRTKVGSLRHRKRAKVTEGVHFHDGTRKLRHRRQSADVLISVVRIKTIQAVY